ncbi:MAG TPA: tetratricopeptide repeat protein, partial [Gammaproteobacteria bacterium]|nr:tetratricopeptide repeat protein [Gammaproteobacteria bacterium]
MLHLVQEAHTALKNKAFDKAAEKAHKAIKSDPLISSAWHILGLVALEQKKYQEAVGFLQKAIQAEPKALYYFNLGIAFKRLNQLEDSIKSYLQCLKMDPKMIRALSNLANVYRANQQYDNALECYQRTLDLDPTNAIAFYNLGILYQSKEAFEDAIKAYTKAIKYNPNIAKAFCNLATIYSKLRRYEKSIQFYERAIKIDRNFFDAYNNLGGTLIELGKFQDAEIQLRKALQLEPASCATLRNLTLCKEYKNPQDKDAKSILKLLKNPKLTSDEVTHLHFALGKIYHDCLLYDKAFFHYQKGNDLHFAKFPFNIFSLQDYTRDIVQLFDEATAVAQKNLTQTKIQPLIILGLPRSGKSVLENILKHHPELCGAGEVGLAEFATLWEKEQQEAFPHIIKKLDAANAQKIVDQYERKILRDLTPKKYVIDTMPGNVFYLGLFLMLFPNARVISIKRDRNDLGLFIYFKYFVNRHHYAYHLKTIGQYYKLYQYLVRHWVNLYRDKILEVRYEDLILHNESTLERMAQFLKIDANAFSFKEPLSSHEIGQHHNFKAYLEPLQQGFQFDPQNDEIRLKEALIEATEKHKNKKYEEAAKLYKYILQYDPNNPVPIHLLGVLAHEMGHDERAIALIKKAIEMNPNYAQAHNNLGVILLKNKRQIEAENHFKIAETIVEAANTEKFKVLTPEHSIVLQDAFLKNYQKIKEHERKILYKGDVKPTTTSFMTKSWDYYFKDLSYGSYRLGGTTENIIWRMRTWHFLFKNLA